MIYFHRVIQSMLFIKKKKNRAASRAEKKNPPHLTLVCLHTNTQLSIDKSSSSLDPLGIESAGWGVEGCRH